MWHQFRFIGCESDEVDEAEVDAAGVNAAEVDAAGVNAAGVNAAEVNAVGVDAAGTKDVATAAERKDGGAACMTADEDGLIQGTIRPSCRSNSSSHGGRTATDAIIAASGDGVADAGIASRPDDRPEVSGENDAADDEVYGVMNGMWPPNRDAIVTGVVVTATEAADTDAAVGAADTEAEFMAAAAGATGGRTDESAAVETP
jgi:hypothetical protein